MLGFPNDKFLHISTKLLDLGSGLTTPTTVTRGFTIFSSYCIGIGMPQDLGVFKSTSPESTRKRRSKIANVFTSRQQIQEK